MKLLIILINAVISVLTGIGDFVLFYLNIIWKIIKAGIKFLIFLLVYILKIPQRITQKILSHSKILKKKTTDQTNLIKFRFSLFVKNTKRRFRPKKKEKTANSKKSVKESLITFYPPPKQAKLKVEYFIFGLLVCFTFIVIPISGLVFLNSLPNPRELSQREIPQTTKIYDRNGTLLYQIYANENRTLVPLNSLPKNLINATIAIEDKDFYKNPGFDINGIARATLADITGKPIQGGSTITQQLIKSTLLTPEVSITRKIKEIVLAFWAEKIYTKNEILEMYFNQVPYGGTAWGIEAASETYFGKNVKDLDLAQSTFLAGMPQAPTTYSPYGDNPMLWKQRQKEVLAKMFTLKYITKDQENQALNEGLIFEPPQTPIYAPHFVMYVKDYLTQKFGLPLVEKGGLIVKTSLDLNLQNKAQDIVTQEVNNDAYLNLTNGAALVTNPANGDILAMVGSRDYNDPNDGTVNLTTSLRQPGSSIKVVTYTAALGDGFTAASILDDSPITYAIPGSESYSPVNYDGKFHGKVPLRIAFANSFNVPAVKTLQTIGISNMVNLAKKMGITTWGDPDQYGLSITLGAAETRMTDMAAVYGTIANLGKRVDLDPLVTVTDHNNDILYQKQEELPNQVIDSGVAYIISNILADNSRQFFGIWPKFSAEHSRAHGFG
jgi:membrane peptidoglycan carboxypeptidase